MKLLHYLFVLSFTLIYVSCTDTKRKEDALRLVHRADGFVDILDPQNEKTVIKHLNASYTNGNQEVFKISDIKGDMISHTFNDKMGEGTEYLFEADVKDDGTKVTWKMRTFLKKPVLVCKMEVRNKTSGTKRINRMNPVFSKQKSGGISLNPGPDLYFLDIVPRTWAPKSIKKLDTSGVGKFVTGIADNKIKGAVFGSLSFDRFRGYFEMKDNRNTSGVLTFDTYHDIDNHLMLSAGDTISSEWIYIDCVNDVLTGLENWAEFAGQLNNAVISNPPATGFYTWYYYREHVSEQIMIENTKFLAENRDKFPVNWVHIDWGWQRKFSTGDTAVNEKFPHGLRWLANEIKNQGFHPSIWINPFMYTNPTAGFIDDHPEIFLRDSGGQYVEREPIRNIMGREFGNGEHMILDGVTNIIDVSNPKSYDFLNDRYNWVSSMDYEMAMMDFIQEGRIYPSNGDKFKYQDVSNIEGIRKALFAAREGLGDETGILGCGTVYETSVGTSNLTRISTDAPAIWSCVKTACNDLIVQYFMNNKLWTNYADGLFVRDKISPYWRKEWWDENGNLVPMRLSDEEAEFYTAVNGLSQAAVMYTEDIKLLKPQRQWLLSLVLPIYEKGVFRPVDLFKTTSPKTLQLKCHQKSRKWIVAAGLNQTDSELKEGLNLAELDMEKNTRYHAFNVFESKYLGLVNSESVLGPVKKHGVILVNLVPDSGRPQLVGTDLHISQGGMEIHDEQWNSRTKKLALELNDLHGRSGGLFIHVPENDVFSHDKNEGFDASIDNDILHVKVKLDTKKSIEITFN